MISRELEEAVLENIPKLPVWTDIGFGAIRRSWLTLNEESEPVDDDFLAERLDIFIFEEGR